LSRREASLSALLVFTIAIAIRAWVATQLTFPRPEDVAYYVGVSRNLVDGHGLITSSIWSYHTPPLIFPRPAFEIWLPLPSFLAAIPMAIFGTTFAAAQVSSVLVGALIPVLAWRLAADLAAERGLPVGRARTLALGAGLTAAVYLPLVLASAEPDSTTPFAALVLLGCLLMNRLTRAARYAAKGHSEAGTLADLRGAPGATASRPATRDLIALGLVLGLAALTRNEAVWLALVWAFLAWGLAGRSGRGRLRPWAILVGIPAIAALVVFGPWAVRDWLTFGTPLPGQALDNALFIRGTDIFAWNDQPTLARYLDAGIATLLGLRVTGFVHNLVVILLALGIPISAIGLVALPWTARGRTLRPLLLFSIVTFAVTTLLFPVATTMGTFQHAAGAIEVLLVISAIVALDALIARVGQLRHWTRPVAWLGPTLAISAGLLFTVVLLPGEGQAGRDTEATYAALPAALAVAGVPLDSLPGPVITDTPVWFAEETGHTAVALPDESPTSVLDLASHFGATLLVVQADNGGNWPAAAIGGRLPGSSCFTPLDLTANTSGATAPALKGTLAFRIGCP
jgi:hypothetical protein